VPSTATSVSSASEDVAWVGRTDTGALEVVVTGALEVVVTGALEVVVTGALELVVTGALDVDKQVSHDHRA